MSNVYIDADMLTVRAAYAAQAAKTSEDETLSKFSQYVENFIDKLEKHTLISRDRFRMGIQGRGNFRYERATIKPYKGNRSRTSPPEHLNAIRNHLVEHWEAVVVTGMETDDWCGRNAIPFTDYIVSNDKDLLTVPGDHVRVDKKGQMHLQRIELEEADIEFYMSVLIGDRGDNVIGLPGYGLSKAEKLFISEYQSEYQDLLKHEDSPYKYDYETNIIKAAVVYDKYLDWAYKQFIKENNLAKNYPWSYNLYSEKEDIREIAWYFMSEMADLLFIHRYNHHEWEVEQEQVLEYMSDIGEFEEWT